jgi:phasin family protein
MQTSNIRWNDFVIQAPLIAAAQHFDCFLGSGTPIQLEIYRSGTASEHDRQRKHLAMTDFASVQKHFAAITTAQTDFAKSSFEANKAYFEKLASVKSPDKFVELTTEYAKSAQETFVAEATKIGELYKAFAQEAFKPITSSFSPK